ncbi:MAG: phage tail spike protein [Clostridium sp.]
MSIEYYKFNNKSYLTDIEQDGDVTLQPIKSIFKIRLNGICQLEILIPYDEEGRWKFIDNGGVIKAQTPFSNAQLFPILNLKRKMNGLEITAIHIMFDLEKSTTEDIRVENKNCKQALDVLLADTIYTGNSNIKTLGTCYFIENNRLALINGSNDNTIIKRWGGEILPDNFNIYINDKIGSDYGVEINYGTNLLDIGLKENTSSVVTRAKPKAFNGRRLPELYVDSPLLDKYRIVHESFIDMRDLVLKEDSTDGTGFDTEEELYEAMRNRTKQLFDKGLDKPVITGEIKIAALENTNEYEYVKSLVNIGLGDTIHVNHKNIGEDILVRCIGYDWDILTRKYLNIIVGDEIKNYFNSNSDNNSKINSVITPSGSVNAEKINGIMNAMNTSLKAQRDVAQKQLVRAILFEDLDPQSPLFGCVALGSKGLEVSDTRTLDNKEWDFSTSITARGLNCTTGIFGLILGLNAVLNLDTGDFALGDTSTGYGARYTSQYAEFNHYDGSKTRIDAFGMTNVIGGSGRAYLNMIDIDSITVNNNSSSGTYGITNFKIPSRYIGKSWKAFVIPSGCEIRAGIPHPGGISLGSFRAFVNSYNRDSIDIFHSCIGEYDGNFEDVDIVYKIYEMKLTIIIIA